MFNPASSRYLLKFFVVSAGAFLIGTTHGMIQVLPPVRKWLESIGTPLHNPGHMIDPLAHAHINLVGGLTIFSMGVIYFLLNFWNDGKLHSRTLANVSFWFTTIGVGGFYSLHLLFGIWEGILVTHQMHDQAEAIHRFYGPSISVFATVMAAGLYIYFYNVGRTVWAIYKK